MESYGQNTKKLLVQKLIFEHSWLFFLVVWKLSQIWYFPSNNQKTGFTILLNVNIFKHVKWQMAALRRMTSHGMLLLKPGVGYLACGNCYIICIPSMLSRNSSPIGHVLLLLPHHKALTGQV